MKVKLNYMYQDSRYLGEILLVDKSSILLHLFIECMECLDYQNQMILGNMYICTTYAFQDLKKTSL